MTRDRHMVREKENIENFVSCRMALSVMILSDLESQNRFRFVLLLRCIRAAYCCRHAVVEWSVYPCGLLLQTCSCGVVGPSTRPIAIGVMVEQPGGQRTGSALLF